nr:RNA-binding Raly-like protein [Misgurnus anguillicaudatus]
MNLFGSKHHSVQYESMTGVLRLTKHKPGVKGSRSEPYRVFDYQHVPISMTIPCDFTPFQAPCSSPPSAPLRKSRAKPQSRHKSRSRGTQLRMEELLCIKKELTLIKSQIDELLDSLERMDPQSKELSGGDVVYSPLHGSVNSVDGSSLKTDRETQSPQTSDSSDEDRQHVHDYESSLLYM